MQLKKLKKKILQYILLNLLLTPILYIMMKKIKKNI